MNITIETIYRCTIDFCPGENLETDQVLEAADKFNRTLSQGGLVERGQVFPSPVADINLYSGPAACYIHIESPRREVVEDIAGKVTRYILRFKGSKIF